MTVARMKHDVGIGNFVLCLGTDTHVVNVCMFIIVRANIVNLSVVCVLGSTYKWWVCHLFRLLTTEVIDSVRLILDHPFAYTRV